MSLFFIMQTSYERENKMTWKVLTDEKQNMTSHTLMDSVIKVDHFDKPLSTIVFLRQEL